MALVHRFILPEVAKAGHDVFIQGLGMFTNGVLDVEVTNTPLIAILQATSYVVDAGVIDPNAPPPVVPPDDPLAAYLTEPKLITSIQDGSDGVAQALRAAYVPKWRPNTVYAVGEPVFNPSGQTVVANAAFTSSAAYNPNNWTVVSGGTGGGGGTAAVSDATINSKGIVQLSGDLAGTAGAPTVPGLAQKASLSHTHVSLSISDLKETVQDTIAAMLVAGTNIAISYDDNAGLLTIDDIGATSGYSSLPAGSTLTVFKSGSTWPARPTSRTDIEVIWKGADPDPSIVASGTGGMLDNVDTRFVTP